MTALGSLIPPAQGGPPGAACAAAAPPAPGSDLGLAGQAANKAAAPGFDQADIRMLDVPAALQILLFEASDALGVSQPAQPVTGADQAAVVIVDAFLQTLPEADPLRAGDPADRAWAGAAGPLEAALEAGLDRAQSIIGAWRGVSSEVMEAIVGSRVMIQSALTDVPPPTFLARPEWLGLAPRIVRHLRLRRRLRRRSADPDDRTPR